VTRARELAVAYPSLPADAPAADLLPSQRAEVAQVDGDATLIEVAAAMARTNAPLVAVRDRDGRLLGGITTSQLITRLLGAPQ
jgi:CBS domain-containing protein